MTYLPPAWTPEREAKLRDAGFNDSELLLIRLSDQAHFERRVRLAEAQALIDAAYALWDAQRPEGTPTITERIQTLADQAERLRLDGNGLQSEATGSRINRDRRASPAFGTRQRTTRINRRRLA